MRIAVEQGRGTRPDLKIGICGEHGGILLHSILSSGRTDYVTCSAEGAYRPTLRLTRLKRLSDYRPV
jgi:hypothetical protein